MAREGLYLFYFIVAKIQVGKGWSARDGDQLNYLIVAKIEIPKVFPPFLNVEELHVLDAVMVRPEGDQIVDSRN